MPIGLQRINSLPSQHPTPNIVFIKALPGPTAASSERFLSRIAAICHPILTKHHLSVTSLEEFPPNREFLGRNFNAGECIQLVIRTRSGALLPFRHVAMVMVHELAHCVQMNHARAFWAVRDAYADEMRALWARSYEGEGFWSRGRALQDGGAEERPPDADDLPAEICGGVYRGRRRGRKRKRAGTEAPKLSYAERQQRRIARKFGTNGTALGENEAVRAQLLRGKKGSPYVRPRVAKSDRGRELRAQAALARLGQQSQPSALPAPPGDSKRQTTLPFKRDTSPAVKEEHSHDSESDYDDAALDADDAGPAATDARGVTLKDEAGRELVRVCPGEDRADDFVKTEREELQDLWSIPPATLHKKMVRTPIPVAKAGKKPNTLVRWEVQDIASYANCQASSFGLVHRHASAVLLNQLVPVFQQPQPAYDIHQERPMTSSIEKFLGFMALMEQARDKAVAHLSSNAEGSKI